MIYALITARKNSKGIKNKNLLKINNKSLFQISINNAKKTKIFDKIFCSTDSKYMIKIAKKNLVYPIKRPDYLSGDKTPSYDVVVNFFKFLKKNKIKKPFLLFLFQPTSPYIKPETIKKMVKIYEKNPKISSVISISKVHNKYHFLNQRIISKNGSVEFLFEKQRKKQLRRQDKQEVFVHGNMFSFKTSEFYKQKTLAPKPIYSVKLKNYFESIDIDDLEDYKKALTYSKILIN